MATVPVKGPGFTIAGNNLYVLGDASDERLNGGIMVHIINDNTLTDAQITVVGCGLEAWIASQSTTMKAIPYRKLYLNGSVGDGSFVSTAITTDSIIFIPAGGLMVALSVASLSAGSAKVYFSPAVGGASL